MCLPFCHNYKIVKLWPGVQEVYWEEKYDYTRYRIFYIKKCYVCGKIKTKVTFWCRGKSKLRLKLAKLGFLNEDLSKLP